MFYSQPDQYVSLLTDFGFKRVFGTEANKRLLMDFLNSLLPDYHTIRSLTFKNPEKLGKTPEDRKAIFDIYCESESGDFFIVELQKAKQNFFKDRSVYYSSFPIQEQAQKGEWIYELTSVYTIGILDFVFDDHKDDPEFVHVVKLKDQHCRVFYEKLTFIYVELPKFTKTLEQLDGHFDIWLYLLRHLVKMDEPPSSLEKEPVFNELFEVAKIANFSRDEQLIYRQDLKVMRDWYAIEMTHKQAKQDNQRLQGELKRAQEEIQRFQEEAQRAQEEAQRVQEEAQRAQEEALRSGIEQGQRSATIDFITRQSVRRFKQEIPDNLRFQLFQLTVPMLEDLTDSLGDFTAWSDLERWLTEQK